MRGGLFLRIIQARLYGQAGAVALCVFGSTAFAGAATITTFDVRGADDQPGRSPGGNGVFLC